METASTLCIYVSGRLFEIPKELLLKYPQTRLGQLLCKSKNDVIITSVVFDLNEKQNFEKNGDTNQKETYSFNRPVTAFKAVLGFYQTGELHMPKNFCPRAFNIELEFWGLHSGMLEECCRYQFLGFQDDYDTTTKFQATIKPAEEKVPGLDSPSKVRRIRARLWSILEHKELTLPAKVVRWTLIICVILSISVVSLDTVELSTSELDSCEIIRYLKETNFDKDVINMLRQFNCTSLDEVEDQIEDLLKKNSSSHRIGDKDYDEDHIQAVAANLKSIARLKHRHVVLYVLDYIVIAFFTLELLLRLITCPHLKYYYLSFSNFLDTLVLLAAYVELALIFMQDRFKHETKGIKFLYYIQVLRCLRIIRFVQNLRAIRVLTYTMKINAKDLMVLLLYILIGVLLFSNFVFFAEDKSNFPNIPESWWWAIITMTTVGYGDFVPKTVIGKIIGSACALTGVLALALIIPVIANSFMTLYQFSHLHEIESIAKKNTNRVSPVMVKEQKTSETSEKVKM